MRPAQVSVSLPVFTHGSLLLVCRESPPATTDRSLRPKVGMSLQPLPQQLRQAKWTRATGLLSAWAKLVPRVEVLDLLEYG